MFKNLKVVVVLSAFLAASSAANANSFIVEGNSMISAFQAVIDASNNSKTLKLTDKSEINCVLDAGYNKLQEEEIDSPNYCLGYLNEGSKRKVIRNVARLAKTKEDKVIANFIREKLNSVKF